jgi:hypothetical protein
MTSKVRIIHFTGIYHFLPSRPINDEKHVMHKELVHPDLENLIFFFKGKRVMVDADLAILYIIPTKALKQQVKRNPERFPPDFMFELDKNEKTELVTNCDRLVHLKHSSVNPMVFTEQGVAMLSSVLHSQKAILVNVEIMRAFVRYRVLLRESEELRKDMNALEQRLDHVFKFLLDRLDELHQQKNIPRKAIGYKIGEKNERETN